MNELFTKHDWSDVIGIPQYDGNPPILNIKYDEDYQTYMDKFRAIVKSGECSERVFDLTTLLLQLLANNYNLYIVRRKCIKALTKNLKEELEYITELALENEKVYQIWEHRRQIVDELNIYSNEDQFLHQILDKDNKNYHAWSYKIWLCQRFNLYERELLDVEYYLHEDIGNNSAWNYRYFLLLKLGQDLHKELPYIFKSIITKPTNEAVWNYLKGYFNLDEFEKEERNNPNRNFKEYNILDYPVETFIEENFKEHDNRFALSILVHIKLFKGEKEIAIQICEKLIILDPIRVKYHTWMIEQIKK